MKCKGIGRNTTLRFTAIAAGLMMAGCQQAAEESAAGPVVTSPPADHAAAPSATDQDGDVAEAAHFLDSLRNARRLGANELGARYCLERTVPGGDSGEQVMRTPLIGIPQASLSAWHTRKPVELTQIKEPTFCKELPVIQHTDRLTVSNRAGQAFRLKVERGNDTLLDRLVSPPGENSDAYLYGAADCRHGERGCSDIKALDAFVYVVEEPRSPNHVAKLVKIDLFPPRASQSGADGEKCDAERLDSPNVIRKRIAATGPCDDLPAWHATLLEPASDAGDARPEQTGTGSGYEPP